MTDVSQLTSTDVSKHVGGATGALGFLKWVEATFPAAQAAAILKAARAKQSTLGNVGRLRGLGLYRQPKLYNKRRTMSVGRLGFLGDSTVTLDPSTWLNTDDYGDSLDSNYTAASTGATSAPASSSWVSSIGSALSTAISAAGQAYLTVSQTQAANSIVQLNLQRAQQGLAPLPYTASQLGLTGPTLNLGVSSSTLMPILLFGGGGLLLFLLMSGGRSSGKKK